MSQSDNRLHLRSTKCFPAMFAKTGRGRRHDAPVWRNSNFVGGHSICPRTDVKLLYKKHSGCCIGQTPYPLFLCRCRRKEKANKRNAKRETRRRKLFEKSFLRTPSKTFGQPAPGCWVRRLPKCGEKSKLRLDRKWFYRYNKPSAIRARAREREGLWLTTAKKPQNCKKPQSAK